MKVSDALSRVATIKEVALRAGIAISTASRALNDLDRVSAETREKVLAAAEELGYVKNSIAASMKTGLTKLIVVIVPDLINEYFTAVIQGVEAEAINRGYFTVVFATNDKLAKERELFDGPLGRIIDGAIIVPAHDDMKYYKNLNKPVIIVDRYLPECGMDAVVVDNYKGAYMLTEELINAGHRDIAILIGPQTFNIGQDRLAGYYGALKDHGVSVKPQYVVPSSWYVESGYENTVKLLSMQNPPTAIFATNNLLCVGAMEAISHRGLKIGRDISIVGFDDSALAEFMEPGVTVVKRATVQMGKIGCEMLIDRLENREWNAQRYATLEVEMVRRGSVKRLI